MLALKARYVNKSLEALKIQYIHSFRDISGDHPRGSCKMIEGL